MNAVDCYQTGQLQEAITAAIEGVKQKPGDIPQRWFLCEMLSFSGDLIRADKHLEAIIQLDPTAAAGVALYRQLLHAETARQQFYSDGRLPEFLFEADADLRLRLEASIRLREGAIAEAAALLVQAEEKRPRLHGTADGQPFEEIRDLDDLSASYFEVLTSTGKYYWVPLNRVVEVEFKAPARARDLLWRQARMKVKDGPDGDVYFPTLYAGSQTHADEKARLGRVTFWEGGADGPTRGIGQRMFLIGDQSRAIGELHQVTFDGSAGQGV